MKAKYLEEIPKEMCVHPTLFFAAFPRCGEIYEVTAIPQPSMYGVTPLAEYPIIVEIREIEGTRSSTKGYKDFEELIGKWDFTVDR